jgi:chemotaxis signal transduction protein
MGTYARVKVASEAYAVPVRHVLEIRELGPGTGVPGAGPAVLGVRNVRGQVLPVVDLAILLEVRNPAPPTVMLVAEAGGVRAGLAVEQVVDVGDLPGPEEPADPGLLAGPVLAGTVLADGVLIGVLDVPRVFEALSGPAS